MTTNQFCKTCLKKPACKTICKKLGKHLDDIEVPQREISFTELLPNLEDDNAELQPSEWPKKATILSILELFFIDGKKQADIADIVMVSHQYISKIIKKYKPIIAENIRKSVAISSK
jgi:hypothetical protein